MKRWVYVRCLVYPPDAGAVSLMNSLAEKVDGQPRADVVPAVHASSLSFDHMFVDAPSKDEAYAIGGRLLESLRPPEAGVLAMNDYVVEIPPPAIVRWANGGS